MGRIEVASSLCSFPLGCNLPDAPSPDLKLLQGMAYRRALNLMCQEQAPGAAGQTLQGHLRSPWGGPGFQARGSCRGGPPEGSLEDMEVPGTTPGIREPGPLRQWRCRRPAESVQKVPEEFGNMLGIQTHTHTNIFTRLYFIWRL